MAEMSQAVPTPAPAPLAAGAGHEAILDLFLLILGPLCLLFLVFVMQLCHCYGMPKFLCVVCS